MTVLLCGGKQWGAKAFCFFPVSRPGYILGLPRSARAPRSPARLRYPDLLLVHHTNGREAEREDLDGYMVTDTLLRSYDDNTLTFEREHMTSASDSTTHLHMSFQMSHLVIMLQRYTSHATT